MLADVFVFEVFGKLIKRKLLMKRCFLCIVISVSLFCFGCSTTTRNTVTQTSTIDALLAGLYDGNISCRQLLKYGNLGIGTFDRLEGEMVIINGTVYQIKANGKVYTPDIDIGTPFASVCQFGSDKSLFLKKGMDFTGFEDFINKSVPNNNIFCAIKIVGEFAQMKTRSVPAQKKPYLPLGEVTKNQPEFHMGNVSGTIVGFRCPPFVKGINVPGYHLHFITTDYKQGGHVLSFEISNGKCDIDLCNQFFLILPKDKEAFENVDLSKDRTEELEKVER